VRRKDLPGRFIVVEGADGSGTTTQARKLADALDGFYTAEPTDSKPGTKVEEMISSEDYSPEAIALNFAADRMIHLEEEVLPRLRNGETLICDRYLHSSLVYQSALGAETRWIETLNEPALKPDLTFVLDVEAETGMKRVEKRGKDENIFENLSFQQEVVTRYRDLKDLIENEISVIDGSRNPEDIHEEIVSKTKEVLDLP